MKKTNLVLVLLFTFTVQLIFSQKIKSARVIYSIEKVLPPDYLEKTDKVFNEETKEYLLGSYYLTSKIYAILKFKDGKSIFNVSEKDIDNHKSKNIKGVNFSLSLVGFEDQYYVDAINNEQFYKGKNLSMKHELVFFEKQKWELIDEQKTILNYVCKKAKMIDVKKNKKEVVVWYTESIPVGFGPKNYFGLPGLVLEVSYGNDTFLATKIDINPKKLKVNRPTAKLKTTLKEKRKIFQKIMQEN